MLTAAVLAAWPWGRSRRRFAVAGVATLLSWVAWHLLLNATGAMGFDVDAPLIRVSWEDVGSGVAALFATVVSSALARSVGSPPSAWSAPRRSRGWSRWYWMSSSSSASLARRDRRAGRRRKARMASPNLIRWGGLATLCAGAFYIVEAAVAPFIADYHWSFHALDAPAHALLAVGVVGLYLWQRSQEHFEWLGTVGVILIVTASVLLTLGGVVLIYIDGVLGTEAEVLNDIVHPLELVVMMGAVLFGMATMRVHVLPSGGALLIIIGALVYFGIKIVGVGPDWLISIAVAIVGAGWVWLGQALWSESGESVQQPKRVR